MLTQTKLKSLLEYNPTTGLFQWLAKRGGPQKLGWQQGCPDGKGYHVFNIEGTLYRTHRLAWLYMYGDWPSKQIDHIDGDKSNNKLINLRDVTQSVNMASHQYLRKLKGLEHWKKVAKARRENQEVSNG